MRVADNELNYWADRFIASGLAVAMTFEQFLCLPPARRDRHLARAPAGAVPRALEDGPADACVRNGRLIEPLHHKPRGLFGRPWFELRRARRGS